MAPSIRARSSVRPYDAEQCQPQNTLFTRGLCATDSAELARHLQRKPRWRTDGIASPAFTVPMIIGDVTGTDRGSYRIDNQGKGVCVFGICQWQPWFIHGFTLLGRPKQGTGMTAHNHSILFVGSNDYGPAEFALQCDYRSFIEIMAGHGGRIFGTKVGFALGNVDGKIVAQGGNHFTLVDTPDIDYFAHVVGPESLVDLRHATWQGEARGHKFWNLQGGQVPASDRLPGHLPGISG
jgi:hypothetical protein